MSQIQSLVARYRRSGLLIDTNLLLLWFVGQVDLTMIGKHKRTRSYSREDFKLLARFISDFETIVPTPSILTEVSNLISQSEDPRQGQFIAAVAEMIGGFAEIYRYSSEIAELPNFRRLGLTDTGIGLVAGNKDLVLTDDFLLAAHLASMSVDCINFNHIRDDAV